MTKTVIFDIGNVLIDWDIRRVYRQLLPDEAEIDRFLREVDWFAWNIEPMPRHPNRMQTA